MHRQMLEQLGLKADSKEGQVMMKELKKKMGSNKKTKKQLESDEDGQEEEWE
jgi:hypothetical protein